MTPTRIFPAWRLPSGNMIKASEDELESSIGSCENWAVGSGVLVIIGVVATVVLAITHPKYDSSLEQWGSAFADVFVAIGVAGEIIFSRLAGLRQDELKRRSDERVAKAELETERLRKASEWRILSAEQQVALLTALNLSGSGASIRFCTIMNEQESISFAYKLSHPFRQAGWTVGFQRDVYAHDIMPGILLPSSNPSWLQADAVLNKRVWQAFVDADIPFVNGWPLSSNLTITDGVALSAPIAFVYVGPKPAPML